MPVRLQADGMPAGQGKAIMSRGPRPANGQNLECALPATRKLDPYDIATARAQQRFPDGGARRDLGSPRFGGAPPDDLVLGVVTRPVANLHERPECGETVV